MSTYGIVSSHLRPTTFYVNSDKLEDNWEFVQPISVDSKIVNIAGNSISRSDSAQINRYGFLINRFRSIHIVLSNKFSFTLEEFMTKPEIRVKAINKFQRILQKKIKKTWLAFAKEAENVGNNVKGKSLPQHITLLNNVLKLVTKTGELFEQDFKPVGHIETLLSLIVKVTKFPRKIKDFHNGIASLELNSPRRTFKAFNTFVEIVHDLGSMGSTIIKNLDNNEFLKIAFETLGLDENFLSIGSEVLELCEIIEGPLTVFRIYLKAVSLFENIQTYSSAASPDEIKKARIKVLCSSLDMAKEIAKISVFALTTLGLIVPPIPIVVTIIISGIGIITFSIKIYTYFAHKEDHHYEIDEMNKASKTHKIQNNATESDSSSSDSSDDEIESEVLMRE
jgi:hypothetical protein